jgi:hypothetical protein
MKRKIALLLAFVMVLTMLPMSVVANPGTLGWASRTGMLAEPAGPSANVRHWGAGVLVGHVNQVGNVLGAPRGLGVESSNIINYSRGHNHPEGLSPAPQGNLRHIIVDAGYFQGRPGINNISMTVDIANVDRWLARANGFVPQSVVWTQNSPFVPDVSYGTGLGNISGPAMAGAPFTLLAPDVHGAIHVEGAGLPAGARLMHIAVAVDNSYLGAAMVATTNTRAQLFIWRSGNEIASTDVFLQIPIEYITRNYTNDRPVFLNFFELSGWPQAGQIRPGAGVPGRTDLSTVTDARFGLSLDLGSDDGPRHFHRYGRANIHPIRIAELAHGAFNHPHWYVHLNIITPGFFWTADSSNIWVPAETVLPGNPGSFHTRYRVGQQTVSYAGGNDIRPLILPWANNNARRYPPTGTNRFRELSFPLTLDGVYTLAERTVNDWFQIEGLAIAAEDRARPGDVEVEVRLYRAGVVGEGTAAVTNWQWQLSQFRTEVDLGTATDDFGNSIPGPFVWSPIMLVDEERAAQDLITGTGLGTPATRQHPAANESRQVWALSTTAGLVSAEGDWVPVPGLGLGYVWVARANRVPGSAPNAGAVYLGTFHSSPITQGGVAGTWGRLDQPYIWRDRLIVARYGQIGLELFLHPDDSVSDHYLRSGIMAWGIDTDSAVRGAVVPRSADPGYHLTARAVLRETVPGSLPATGAHPTTFTFDEGIQVLGARIWTNQAYFSVWDDTDGEVWFGDHRNVDEFLNASIVRNTLTLRPEIGDGTHRRDRIAQITVEFYLSVQANHEGLFGPDIEVTVNSGTIESPFEESLVIARAWDPVALDTSVVLVDDIEDAAFGLVRAVPINDVTVTEVEAGILEVGTRVWVGVEGGISRGWGAADHVSLGARGARVVGCPTLTVSTPRLDSHGVYVEILRGSRYDGAQIVFYGVEISGRVIPEQSYNVFLWGDAIAANWDGFAWLRADEHVRFTRGTLHGHFVDEPYATPSFTFEGADIYGAPPVVVPPVTPPPPPRANGPVTFFQHSSHVLRDGDTVTAPVFMTVPNITNPNYVTSYVSARVVADLAGWPWGNGFSTFEGQTAIFSDGVNTVEFTHGSTTAMVNGVPTPITAGGLGADARIIQDRMMVPISFFNLPNVPLPLSVRWNPYTTAADRSITITPLG